MFDAKFAFFLANFKRLDITLEDTYNKYKDNLNSYKEA
jgi:hypothetical protein